ncbi:MAG: hypothetical protein AAGF85_17125 [Bacteroidota bacterium]
MAGVAIHAQSKNALPRVFSEILTLGYVSLCQENYTVISCRIASSSSVVIGLRFVFLQEFAKADFKVGGKRGSRQISPLLVVVSMLLCFDFFRYSRWQLFIPEIGSELFHYAKARNAHKLGLIFLGLAVFPLSSVILNFILNRLERSFYFNWSTTFHNASLKCYNISIFILIRFFE